MRRLLLLAMFVALALGAAAAGPGSETAQANGQRCGAGANGSSGYAYAGHQATEIAHGVRATITPTVQPNVVAGHVAAWIGVGGPGQGAGGQTLWLQVGIASMPDTPTMVYAEVTRGGRDPVFMPLLRGIAVGESHTVSVLEMSNRPNYWRVWLDGTAVTEPILLANSTNRWRPIATAESWNGNRAVCNRFGFRFNGVSVAASTGGSWQAFAPGHRFLDRGFDVKRLSGSIGGQRVLSGDTPSPYAFEASSVS
ncbi:MAG: hypothetical protein LH654_15905 [Thermoleophilia bacterium]|nr:hypothetical protein [Thermoleophilia bacterium]